MGSGIIVQLERDAGKGFVLYNDDTMYHANKRTCSNQEKAV